MPHGAIPGFEGALDCRLDLGAAALNSLTIAGPADTVWGKAAYRSWMPVSAMIDAPG